MITFPDESSKKLLNLNFREPYQKFQSKLCNTFSYEVGNLNKFRAGLRNELFQFEMGTYYIPNRT
jgi:hypothetical protein